MFWTTLILKEEKKGVFPLLLPMAVLLPLSLSLGLLQLNLSKLSNQYEWPSEIKSESNLFFSGQDFSSFGKETDFIGKKKGWLNGNQKVERSLPTMNKQIKTAAIQNPRERDLHSYIHTVLHFGDIQVSTVAAHK